MFTKSTLIVYLHLGISIWWKNRTDDAHFYVIAHFSPHSVFWSHSVNNISQSDTGVMSLEFRIIVLQRTTIKSKTTVDL